MTSPKCLFEVVFSISNLHNTPPTLSFNLESTASFAIKIASKICLPSTKAFWDSKITFPITFSILLANTLANNLYRLPTRLIGLKSFRSSALPLVSPEMPNGVLWPSLLPIKPKDSISFKPSYMIRSTYTANPTPTGLEKSLTVLS